MLRVVRAVLRRVRNALAPAPLPPASAIEQWRERARRFGARAVLNLAHPESEVDRVTELQRAEILPVFRRVLRGTERTAVDLGCGPGRFTLDVARAIGGECIGIDPVPELLALAPREPGVRYALMSEGQIPLGDASADVAFICLVLGGLRGETLTRTIREVDRILRPGGLVFLTENTTELPSASHWEFRSPAEYAKLFPFVALEALHSYDDVGERITVMAGRKPGSTP